MSDPNCPIECPNRSTPVALRVFGQKIDPLEVVAHCLVLTLFLIPASRRSIAADFSPAEALQWMGGLGVASAIVRKLPTDRLNAYFNVFKPPTPPNS